MLQHIVVKCLQRFILNFRHLNCYIFSNMRKYRIVSTTCLNFEFVVIRETQRVFEKFIGLKYRRKPTKICKCFGKFIYRNFNRSFTLQHQVKTIYLNNFTAEFVIYFSLTKRIQIFKEKKNGTIFQKLCQDIYNKQQYKVRN